MKRLLTVITILFVIYGSLKIGGVFPEKALGQRLVQTIPVIPSISSQDKLTDTLKKIVFQDLKEVKEKQDQKDDQIQALMESNKRLLLANSILKKNIKGFKIELLRDDNRDTVIIRDTTILYALPKIKTTKKNVFSATKKDTTWTYSSVKPE